MAINLSKSTDSSCRQRILNIILLFLQPVNFCGKIRTWLKKLVHCLDLTNGVNERRLLDILFQTHLAYFIIFAVLPYLEIKLLLLRMKADKNENHVSIRISIALLVGSVLGALKCVTLLGLARKPKQTQSKLRFYLRWYKLWIMSTLPGSIILLLYLKLWHLAPPKWSFDAGFSVVLMCVLMALKIYLSSLVIRTYHKLGSQVIEKLIKHKEDDETGQDRLQFHMNNSSAHNIPSAIDKQNHMNIKDPGQQKNYGPSQVSLATQSEGVEISNRLFRDKIISPLNISIDTDNVIGEGQFGTVFPGTLRRNCTCHPKIRIAAKIVKNCEKGDTLQMLLQEIKIAIMAGDHPNVVLFYGISSDASLNAQCAIITEFCEMGSLQSFLTDNRHTFVNLLREKGNIIYKDQKLYINLDVHGTHSSLDLMRFAHQIAVGMDHLSSRKIIHADLACRNILLTKDLTIKLSDFGMSRRLYGYQLYLSGAQENDDGQADKFLPWRWMSYEAIKDLKFSVKSDVWSFAVVLYEIFTLGGFPFENLTWSMDILQKIENGMRLERPAFAPEEIYEVMKSCWNLNPCIRPSFKELRTILSSINAHQGKSLPLMS